MGTWKIEISGTGCHHNNDPSLDADLAARAFVAGLKGMGHSIRSAGFQLTVIEYPEDGSPPVDRPARKYNLDGTPGEELPPENLLEPKADSKPPSDTPIPETSPLATEPDPADQPLGEETK